MTSTIRRGICSTRVTQERDTAFEHAAGVLGRLEGPARHGRLQALERIDSVRGEVFNVGGGPENTLSLLELVQELGRAFGRRFDPPMADWRPGDQRVFVADIRKAERLLGWSPRVSTSEGINMLLDWVQAHSDLFVDLKPTPLRDTWYEGVRVIPLPPDRQKSA